MNIRIRRFALGVGLAIAAVTAGAVVPAATAFADSTCYTGCVAPVTAASGSGPVARQSATTSIEPKVSSSSLAFTGADIEQMVGIGAAALGVGGLFVWRSRRRRATA